MDMITPEALKKRLDAKDPSLILVDVREKKEMDGAFGAYPRVYNKPLADFDAFDPLFWDHPEDEIVLICSMGTRAGLAQEELEREGVENTRVLRGGLVGWKRMLEKAQN